MKQLETEEKSIQLLKTQINSIVKAIQKLLRNKNAKTRQGCFALLTQLVNVYPGALENHFNVIIQGIVFSLKYCVIALLKVENLI